MKCRLCGSKKTRVERKARIRSGSAKSGKFTGRKYALYACDVCQVRFLDHFLGVDFYREEKYRKSFDGSTGIEKYQESHDEEKNDIIYRIGLHTLRNKKIADFGSGAGNFLDAVYGFASKTIAIEPALHYHPYLNSRHEVYFRGGDFIKSKQRVDVATSLSVIEHLEDPAGHLKELYSSLCPGGRLFLKTPNYRDILNGLAGEGFMEYFIRTSHSWYFCKESLGYLFRKSPFKRYAIGGIHKYDVSNLLLWLKEGRPTGSGKVAVFDEAFNKFYRSYLENKGLSSHLWVEATR